MTMDHCRSIPFEALVVFLREKRTIADTRACLQRIHWLAARRDSNNKSAEEEAEGAAAAASSSQAEVVEGGGAAGHGQCARLPGGLHDCGAAFARV